MKTVTGILLLGLSVFNGSAFGAENTVSLYSYSGYIATPSAYVTDGRIGFHYTYLPNHVGPFRKGKSPNWIFSGTLGFLPFVETYFSVYVAPRVNINRSIFNYGADKTRSPGVKIRLVKEGKWVPAVAIGVFDPVLGNEFSSNTITSQFVVSSKSFGHGSASLGYGYKTKNVAYARLKGFFGGVSYAPERNVSLLADYDGELFGAGINARWRGFDVLVAGMHGHGVSVRAGYQWQLTE
jgi:hypothetical protein